MINRIIFIPVILTPKIYEILRRNFGNSYFMFLLGEYVVRLKGLEGVLVIKMKKWAVRLNN